MYRTIIFSVNLYRRKTWSAALIEKNVLRVIEGDIWGSGGSNRILEKTV
jgi:hypothetical protein